MCRVPAPCLGHPAWVPMASWANLPPGTEVLVLGRFPQLENSQFFNSATSFQVEGLDGPEPRIIVDGTFCFRGRHQRPMSTNLLFSEDKSEDQLQGASEHVVRFELDRSGAHLPREAWSARSSASTAKEPAKDPAAEATVPRLEQPAEARQEEQGRAEELPSARSGHGSPAATTESEQPQGEAEAQPEMKSRKKRRRQQHAQPWCLAPSRNRHRETEVPSLSLTNTSVAQQSLLDASTGAETRRPLTSRLPPPFPPRTPPSHRSSAHRSSARHSQQTHSGSAGTWHKATTDSFHSSQPPRLRSAWATSQSFSARGRAKGDEAFRRSEKTRSVGNMPDLGLHHSEAKEEAPEELTVAMHALFDVYDKDRSGSVNLDDFVETQAEVLWDDEGMQSLPLEDLVAQYLEVRRPGCVGLDGAGLDFEGFVRWQLQWQSPLWVTGTEKEIVEHCLKLKEHLMSRRPPPETRSTSKRSAPSSRLPFTSRLRQSCRRRWPPGKARAAERPGTTSARTARCRRYGGHATAARGFCEPPAEVARDIAEYEAVQNLREEESDDESWARKLLEATADEEETKSRTIGEAPMGSSEGDALARHELS
ncbi:unnamed protein product [Symbiodinium natans]|uniref:EF-hand domain-containing protein n=1 Tax=Symbiodinium natans TaxID=878477 RepID=A0A812IH15_9DINO|nr:unnamed protein product [Symbiodinium natans]